MTLVERLRRNWATSKRLGDSATPVRVEELERLLDVVEAAQTWHAVTCARFYGCDNGEHDFQCPVSTAEETLHRAVDALNGGK